MENYYAPVIWKFIYPIGVNSLLITSKNRDYESCKLNTYTNAIVFHYGSDLG